MAQKKAHEVDAWLARPDPDCRILLLYGPDHGLVSERARSFVVKAGFPLDDPFSVVRLDASEIDRSPGRLIDEANTIPMFADRRLVWIRNAGAQKGLAEEVKALAVRPPEAAMVVVEAGDLKKTSPLRSSVEAARLAMALPCFADEGRSIDALIDAEMREAGLLIAPDARQALKAVLGGDRMASRSELRKLATYAMGTETVSLDDVVDATGDVSGLSTDRIVDALLAAEAEPFEQLFSRLAAAGGQIQTVLSAALRQFVSLHLVRAAMEEKRMSASAAVATMRPPVYGQRQKLIEAALSRWNADQHRRIIERLQSAVLETRRSPHLADAICRHAFLSLLTMRATNR